MAIERKQPQVAPQPEEQESLLGTLGDIGLSGLGMLGNALDLPGSMVRDTLAGENPFDQLLDPLSHWETGRSVDGRQLLSQNFLTSGMFSENKETGISGWLDDPMEGVQDIAGFAAELALDPLAWATGWAKGARLAEASKAGKVSKAAASSGGIRRAVDKFGDTMDVLDPGHQLGKAAHASPGIRRGVKSMGEAASAQKSAVKANRIYRAAAKATKPIRNATRERFREAFDIETGGASRAPVQDGAKATAYLKDEIITKWSDELFPLVDNVIKMKEDMPIVDQEKFFHGLSRSISTAMETKGAKITAENFPDIPEGLHEPIQRMKDFYNNDLMAYAKENNVHIKYLQDEMVDYVHRQMLAPVKEWIKRRGASTTGDTQFRPSGVTSAENQGRRSQLLKDGERNAFNDVTSDPEVHSLLDRANVVKDVDSGRFKELGIDEEFDYSELMEMARDRMEEVANGRILPDMKVVKDGKYTMLDENGIESVFDQAKLDSMVPDAQGVRVDANGKQFTHKTADRFAALAEHTFSREIYQQTGGIYTNPMHAMEQGVQAASTVVRNAAQTTNILENGFKSGILQLPSKTRDKGMTLGQMFDSGSFTAMDRTGVYNKVYAANDHIAADMAEHFARVGGDAEDVVDFRRYMNDIQIDPDIWEDMNLSWNFLPNAKSPGVAGTRENAFRSFTSLFKAGVLTHPARYTRDGISGQIQNITHGIFSFKSLKSSFKVLFNMDDESLLQIPEITNYMNQHGLEQTPGNATKAVRQMYAARHRHSSTIYHDVDNLDTSMNTARDFESMGDIIPGQGNINSPVDLLKEIGATAAGRRGGNFNPLNVAGFNGRTETTFGAVQAGELAGRYMDDANRMVGFIESMRKGVSADEAMKIVNKVQLNYDPKTFTPTEQELKRFFPFYSFFSGELRYLSNELMTNPTGRLGKLIRASHRAGGQSSDDDQYVPEHVRANLAIPLGESSDGGQNYLTGLGLMHEDPIATVFGGLDNPQEGFRNFISKMNPLIKGPVEYALGRSSFQGGPLGGRDISDMDPVMGRILTQLGIQDPLPNKSAAPFISRGAEFIASNSPASRVLSSTKGLLDDRKTLSQRALNFMTGLRVSTVSPEQSRRALRDIGNRIARDTGARAFSTYHVSKDQLEHVKDTAPEEYKKLVAISRKRSEWEKERRAEVKRKKLASQ